MMINNEILPVVEITPTTTIKHTIIWLHGLGADGNDFAPIVPELNVSEQYGIKFIFPHAPHMPVTINNGYVMRAWFDIPEANLANRVDFDGVYKSMAAINAIIEQEERNGVNSENIMLAGFSQGSVMAMVTGLLYPKRLAGVIALSGLMPHAEMILAKASTANQQLPIFMAHGTEDNIVPYAYGEQAYQALKAAGYPVSFHGYVMGHSVCGEEVKNIADFIKNVLE